MTKVWPCPCFRRGATPPDAEEPNARWLERAASTWPPLHRRGFLTAVGRALAAYRDPGLWRWLQQTGMRLDFSWERAAERYAALYALAVERAASRATGR